MKMNVFPHKLADDSFETVQGVCDDLCKRKHGCCVDFNYLVLCDHYTKIWLGQPDISIMHFMINMRA